MHLTAHRAERSLLLGLAPDALILLPPEAPRRLPLWLDLLRHSQTYAPEQPRHEGESRSAAAPEMPRGGLHHDCWQPVHRPQSQYHHTHSAMEQEGEGEPNSMKQGTALRHQ